jgi:hypothetical protein
MVTVVDLVLEEGRFLFEAYFVVLGVDLVTGMVDDLSVHGDFSVENVVVAVAPGVRTRTGEVFIESHAHHSAFPMDIISLTFIMKATMRNSLLYSTGGEEKWWRRFVSKMTVKRPITPIGLWLSPGVLLTPIPIPPEKLRARSGKTGGLDCGGTGFFPTTTITAMPTRFWESPGERLPFNLVDKRERFWTYRLVTLLLCPLVADTRNWKVVIYSWWGVIRKVNRTPI